MRKYLLILCSALLLWSCTSKKQSDDGEQWDDGPVATVFLQPYGDFTMKEAEQARGELQSHVDTMLNAMITVKVLPHKDLSKSFYNKERNRYRADKIINSLKKSYKSDPRPYAQNVLIGLTHRDISTSYRGKKDWGVIGLTIQPGLICVVSTYRMERHSDLWKVITHELIHSLFGYPHCPNNNPHCLMQDAHGKNTFDKKNGLCRHCDSMIGLPN